MKSTKSVIFIGILTILVLAVLAGCSGAPASEKDPDAIIQQKLGTNAAGAIHEAPLDDPNAIKTTPGKETPGQAVPSVNSASNTTPATNDESLALVQTVAQKAASLNNYRYEMKSGLSGKYNKYLRLDNLLKKTEWDLDKQNSGNWTAVSDEVTNMSSGQWQYYSYPIPEYPGSTQLRDLVESKVLSQSVLMQTDEYKWHTTALMEMVDGYIQNGKDGKFTILKGSGQEKALNVTSITSKKDSINLQTIDYFGSKKNYSVLAVEVLISNPTRGKGGRELFYFDESSGMLVRWASGDSSSIDFFSDYINTSPNSVGAESMHIQQTSLYPRTTPTPK